MFVYSYSSQCHLLSYSTIFTTGHSLFFFFFFFLGVIYLSCIYFTYLQFILYVAGGKITQTLSNVLVNVNGQYSIYLQGITEPYLNFIEFEIN